MKRIHQDIYIYIYMRIISMCIYIYIYTCTWQNKAGGWLARFEWPMFHVDIFWNTLHCTVNETWFRRSLRPNPHPTESFDPLLRSWDHDRSKLRYETGPHPTRSLHPYTSKTTPRAHHPLVFGGREYLTLPFISWTQTTLNAQHRFALSIIFNTKTEFPSLISL